MAGQPAFGSVESEGFAVDEPYRRAVAVVGEDGAGGRPAPLQARTCAVPRPRYCSVMEIPLSFTLSGAVPGPVAWKPKVIEPPGAIDIVQLAGLIT